jgi:hypothetical protein
MAADPGEKGRGTAVAVWLAVDPGARETGAVVVQDPDTSVEELLHHEVVARYDNEAVWAYGLRLVERLTAIRWGFGDTSQVAVEGVVAPNPHLGVVSVGYQQDTAVVFGVLVGWRHGVTVVRPGRHGKHPLATYPRALVGPRENGAYGSSSNPLRHCRSALDVARAAPRMARLQAAGAGA